MMSAITAYFRSLAARFFHRSLTENDLEEELRSHIQLRANDLERLGLTRAEAERRARIEFGGHERFKEECREAIAGNAQAATATASRKMHAPIKVAGSTAEM